MPDRTEKRGWFDSDGFYAALDAVRRARDLNWKQVAAQSGVSASTLTRMAQGKRPDVDGFAALVAWSGLDADDYVRSDDEERPTAEPLAMTKPRSWSGAVADRAAKTITEEQLLTAVASALEQYGWLWCHFRPARTQKGWRTALQGHKGFPDIVAVRGYAELLFIELKSQRGRTTPDQDAWSRALLGSRAKVARVPRVYLWRPSDWLDGTIEGVLR